MPSVFPANTVVGGFGSVGLITGARTIGEPRSNDHSGWGCSFTTDRIDAAVGKPGHDLRRAVRLRPATAGAPEVPPLPTSIVQITPQSEP
jgi:hypothetical protein